MGWQIEFADAATKQLRNLDRTAAQRILAFLRTRVAEAPGPRGTGEPLKGSRFGELWRYRVGDYRVIASIEDQRLRVLVVQIGHRRDVYR